MKKFLLLCIVFAIPAGISRCVEAAAPCNMTDANFKLGYPIINGDGTCAIYYCSQNHLWNAYYLCGNWASGEVNANTINKIRDLAQGPQAARDAAWDAVAAIVPAAGSADERLGQAASAAALAAYPLDAPIDGLVTQHTEVYKQRLALNTYSLVAYGSVALGLPCDATHHVDDPIVGRVYTIDNTKVKRLVANDPLPAVLYARCQP